MAWIKQVPDGEATGLLEEQYEAALKRAGRVFNIVRVMSLNPRVMKASFELYASAVKGASPLTRSERELLATVVSVENQCHY